MLLRNVKICVIKKTCMKRHQKLFRYAAKCKRQATCEYKHNTSSEENSLKAQIKCLEAKIKELLDENKKTSAPMAGIEKELKASLAKEVKENKRNDSIISGLKERVKK